MARRGSQSTMPGQGSAHVRDLGNEWGPYAEKKKHKSIADPKRVAQWVSDTSRSCAELHAFCTIGYSPSVAGDVWGSLYCAGLHPNSHRPQMDMVIPKRSPYHVRRLVLSHRKCVLISPKVPHRFEIGEHESSQQSASPAPRIKSLD